MEITRRSMMTNEEHTLDIDITPEQLDRWKGGELIQRVAPHLTPADREFIMTGTTGEEWNQFMEGDDEK